jgi:hypothetical protein
MEEEKNNSIWPLPGKYFNYPNTLYEILLFLTEKQSDEKEFIKWLSEKYSLSENSSTIKNYANIARNICVVDKEDDILVVNNNGKTFLETNNNSLIANLLIKNFFGFKEIIRLLSEGPLKIADIHKKFKEEIYPNWTSKNQVNYRIYWMLGFEIIYKTPEGKLALSIESAKTKKCDNLTPIMFQQENFIEADKYNNETNQISDIKVSIDQFLKDLLPDERYSSFDYCYNYFYSFYKENRLNELSDNKNLQTSCLELGFFLASWGMLKPRTLLKKSAKYYTNLIIAISKMNPKLWEIDIDNYTDENISLLLDCKNRIFNALDNDPTETLITKIMLGVFANVPALDQFVKKSLKINILNKESILIIKGFYEKNKSIFDSYKIQTFDFQSSTKTNIIYTKAKLVDMCCFIFGKRKD